MARSSRRRRGAALIAALMRRRSKNRCGGKETRTPDPLHAMQMLYQLSYAPATDRRPFAPHVARALKTRKSTRSDGIRSAAPNPATTRKATIIASLDAALVNV